MLVTMVSLVWTESITVKSGPACSRTWTKLQRVPDSQMGLAVVEPMFFGPSLGYSGPRGGGEQLCQEDHWPKMPLGRVVQHAVPHGLYVQI